MIESSEQFGLTWVFTSDHPQGRPDEIRDLARRSSVRSVET
jgi:hypothetical protein